ncbi:MAG: SusD/RagB family nutrient-binding outer membrane lipoprotein, partial [Chryseobacterium sp.]|nr:SusD/RagB family nutrient-binding outer membrane lipoprotein [Chryseobacterium sp.]
MKKILIPILGMTTLLFFNSCSDDFLDVNKNVNEAYTNQVSPKDRLSAAESVVFRTQANTMNRFGNLMMNAWAGNIYYFASPYGDEFKMRTDSQFYSNIWDNLYLGVSNLQTIIDAPDADKYPHHVAAAKIMKAYYMQMIVDLYNDVPYSEAFKGQANKHPRYDKGKDVYKGLMAELNRALVLINQTPDAANALAFTEDPIYQGTAVASGETQNVANWRIFWRKMANTVKLKMLVRLSNCTDSDVVAWRNAELQTMAPLTSNLANFIDKDVRIQPGYNTASAEQRNPFYSTYGRIDLDASDIGQDFRLTFASEHIINSLVGNTPQTSGVQDKRVLKLFMNNGMDNAPGTPANITAMVGQPQGGGKVVGAVEGDFATLGDFMIYNNGTGASLAGYVLTASEVKFLQAEAAVVYPATMAFNAQTVFNDGITQSFTTLGAGGDAAAYITAIATKPGVGWGATANKIQAIQYQKWVALTNINPTETFISHSKTGFPQLPMPIGSYYTSRPKRLMYPQSEYISNTANVPNP